MLIDLAPIHVHTSGNVIMAKLTIPHDALVFAGDGQRALFLRNRGDEKYPKLAAVRVFEEKNPPTHEQGNRSTGTRIQAGSHKSP